MLKDLTVESLSVETEVANQGLLGLSALVAEVAAQGVSVDSLFMRTGVRAADMEDPRALISHRQRLAVYRNARALAKRSDVALLAGARQRVSDYGIYGYALLSSATFGDALDISLRHVTMAGPAVRRISFRVEGGTAVLRSHGLEPLGDLLPFAAEYWRSSMTSLFGHVLASPFPSKRMRFTYPPPPHWRHYGRMFSCPIDFGADEMEWHFDASTLERPCPNSNPITAQVCQQLCERVIADAVSVPNELAQAIRAACFNGSGHAPTAAALAPRLGLSLRTLHRRLAADGLTYQSVVDGFRRSLAVELLENTDLAIDQVAERVGFADAVGFRKAFRKWTGRAPTSFRREGSEAVDDA